MLKILNRCNDECRSSAKVVDGNLILSLPNAINPIVWRMELGSVKASALEVREGANGQFILTLKTPKGDVHEIAPFAARDVAVHALMRVSAALQSAEGRIAQPSQTASVQPAPAFHKEGGSSKKWLIALGLILLFIFFIAWIGGSAPVRTSGDNNFTAGQNPSPDNSLNGVPQSADEMLRGF